MHKQDADQLNNVVTSSGSTYVSDIIGIVFGGYNSRFWMLRKHFNSMSTFELDKVPFHSWDCISL